MESGASQSEFEGKGVLITGGGSGIGAFLVEAFAKRGARVALIDIDREAAQALVKSLSGDCAFEPVFIHADLRETAQAIEAVEATATAIGGIKVLINNAAWDDRHEIGSVTSEYWDANQAVNLKQVFFVTQAALPYLKREDGASIINFSSIAYLRNMGALPVYAAAKAGIVGLTKSLAGKLGKDNIRVNAILPGMIVTERQKDLWLTEGSIAQTVAQQCLNRVLTGADLVGPCLYLASSASSAMTAQTMIIDGGLL